ncbi:MAG: hypothetical protein WA146_06600 [Thiobacillus sp.]
MKRFVIGIRWPIALILVNYAIASALPLFLSEELTDWIFLGGRVVVTLLVGWLVIWNAIGGWWLAALAGALLNFIDHVICKGGYYLVIHFFAPDSIPFSALQSFWGVLISYIMFLWVPMGVAVVGALAAKLLRRLRPPNPPLQRDAPQAARP